MDTTITILLKMCEVWAKARMPIAEHSRIVQKMKSLLDR